MPGPASSFATIPTDTKIPAPTDQIDPDGNDVWIPVEATPYAINSQTDKTLFNPSASFSSIKSGSNYRNQPNPRLYYLSPEGREGIWRRFGDEIIPF